MDDDKFWSLITLLDWSKTGDDEAVVEPLIKALCKMPVHDIYRFEDILSKKLWLLDTQEHAEATSDWKKSRSLSSDGFLYDRCCVIANGEQFFKEVLEHPERMPQNLSFEPLLYVAHKAYRQKTGEDFMYIPGFSYETYSNLDAWN